MMEFKEWLYLFETKKITQKGVVLPEPHEISPEEQEAAMSGLSDAERQQLGTKNFVPSQDWARFRKYMLNRSIASNPSLRPELTAFTPGETVKLMDHPEIQQWYRKVERHPVPPQYDTVVFVPCAKSKPWEGCKVGIYKSYNQLKGEYGNLYFVTISEPLGVVPQDMWNEFPQYDNPGLFKDPVQRSGLFTQDWKKLFGSSGRLQTPFDQENYGTAIQNLSQVIKSFVQFNKAARPDLRFVSFVEDDKGVGTHSDMLTRAGVLDVTHRFKKRAKAREEPYPHIKDTLKGLNYIK